MSLINHRMPNATASERTESQAKTIVAKTEHRALIAQNPALAQQEKLNKIFFGGAR